jgi:hypothetical protein
VDGIRYEISVFRGVKVKVGLLTTKGRMELNLFALVPVADCRTSLHIPGESGPDKCNSP